MVLISRPLRDHCVSAFESATEASLPPRSQPCLLYTIPGNRLELPLTVSCLPEGTIFSIDLYRSRSEKVAQLKGPTWLDRCRNLKGFPYRHFRELLRLFDNYCCSTAHLHYIYDKEGAGSETSLLAASKEKAVILCEG